MLHVSPSRRRYSTGLLTRMLLDRQSLRDQLEHVVVDAEVFDGHDLAAVHRHADVLQLDAEEQIAAETSIDSCPFRY